MAKVYFVYSHKDESFRDRLETHLSPFKRQGIIETWHDRRIGAGRHIDQTVDENLEAAEIILLLISADFIASDYCHDIEMQRALERHARGEARVIPVIVRQCAWHGMPFGRLNAVPRDGTPIASFADQDVALAEIAEAIREVASSSALGTRDRSAASSLRTEARRAATGTSQGVRGVRLRREFTDRDRDAFLDDAFEHMSNYFQQALQAIESEHRDVETRFRRTSADAFAVKVYVRGSVKAECAVWMGHRAFGGGIAFSWNASTDGGMNEQLSVADDGYELHLRPWGMQTRTTSPQAMTKEQAAEYYWELLARRIEE